MDMVHYWIKIRLGSTSDIGTTRLFFMKCPKKSCVNGDIQESVDS